jgi:hypothetical protein
MGRKRRPLDINGETVDLTAPGLQFVRRTGVLTQYWVANPEARRRGYKPRTVRLHYDLSTSQGRSDLECRCVVLTNEMLVWLGNPEGQGDLRRHHRGLDPVLPDRRQISVSWPSTEHPTGI